MDDIFAVNDTPAIDPAKDYFAELVGEDKKFKTPQDLARAKAESDAFIKQVLNEKRQLEEDLKTRTNMQDFLDQMKSANQPPVAVPLANQPAIPNPAPSDAPDLEALVNAQLEKREAENARSRNLIDVRQKLQEVYGDDYASRVKQRATELGIPIEWLNDAAAKSPKAFFELVGLNRQPTDNIRQIPGTVNTAQFGADKNVKNWAYYNNMRKAEPTRYHSKQIQAEMWEQAKKLGPDFA